MEVNRVSPDLIRSKANQVSGWVELGVIEYAHFRTAHFPYFDVPQIDIGTRCENHMSARACRVFRPYHHVPADVAHMRQKFQLAAGIACTFVSVSQGRCEGDLVSGN